uniref:Transcription initiation factor TFIID subunit 8 n=1 Tax=Rhabditophanes sp. KR3021 TaxID=114890 RepID=A0AC35U0S6_9BILA
MSFFDITDKEPPTEDEVNEGVMKNLIGIVMQANGYESTNENIFTLLTNLAKTYIIGLGQTAKRYGEHAGRTDIKLTDIQMACVENGQGLEEITKYMEDFYYLSNHPIARPNFATIENCQVITKIGERQVASFVPQFLPPFPDPHTYIRTKIQTEPECNYVSVRITEGNNLRTSQESVRDYMLRIHPTIPLFPKYVEMARKQAQTEYYDKKLAICKDHVPDFKANYISNYGEGKPSLEDLEMAEEGFKNQLRLQGLNEHLYYTPLSVKQLVFEKVPTYSLLLEPQPEAIPYLRALLPNDINEEDEEEENEAMDET